MNEELFRQTYEEYMKSPEWERIRQIRVRIDGGRCAMCGKKTDELQCHHMTYRNFQHEDPFVDVVSLCKSCHESVHALMNRPTGRRDDGSIIYGWSDVLPRHIRQALEKRGLM